MAPADTADMISY